jgi:NADH-quinone oxidoreductase subunit M
VNTWVAFLATTGVILSAGYALWLYRRVVFGTLEKKELTSIADLTPREIACFAPLVILTILFGIWPAPILDTSANAVAALTEQLRAALTEAPTLVQLP